MFCTKYHSFAGGNRPLFGHISISLLHHSCTFQLFGCILDHLVGIWLTFQSPELENNFLSPIRIYHQVILFCRLGIRVLVENQHLLDEISPSRLHCPRRCHTWWPQGGFQFYLDRAAILSLVHVGSPYRLLPCFLVVCQFFPPS